MEYYATCNRNNAVSYTHWRDRLDQLIKEKEIELRIENNELHDFYHADVSVLEVYYIIRIREAKSAKIDITWLDEWGKELVTFTNNESLRHFYKLNPKLKVIMEFEKERKNY